MIIQFMAGFCFVQHLLHSYSVSVIVRPTFKCLLTFDPIFDFSNKAIALNIL